MLLAEAAEWPQPALAGSCSWVGGSSLPFTAAVPAGSGNKRQGKGGTGAKQWLPALTDPEFHRGANTASPGVSDSAVSVGAISVGLPQGAMACLVPTCKGS